MKRVSPICLVALSFYACDSNTKAGASRPLTDRIPEGALEIVGTVEWYSFEGGFWAIRGSDGNTYDPSLPLDARWHKPSLPVRAVVRILHDVVSIHMAGQVVDVLQIEQLSCEGLPCPSPPPAVVVGVAGNDPPSVRTVAVLDATLSNVRRPPSAGITPAFDCANRAPRGYTTVTTMCLVFGLVPGVYEADVQAAGYRTGHVRVEVPEHVIQPYECCAASYVPQTVWVDLDPG